MTKYTFKTQFATEFEHIPAKINCPTILYLHGFCSDPWGKKPETVKSFCLQSGVGLFRFEYAGHGSDLDNFEKADFEIWRQQVFEIIEDVIKGDIYLVGSSMGGWLSLLAAIKYPTRVKGLIGLAAAPNFVKKFADKMGEEQKELFAQKGKIEIPTKDFNYTITKRFVDTALQNCLPEDGSFWKINCPVHLIQGMKDDSLLWSRSLEFAELIESDFVEIKLLKSSDHRLNDDVAIAELYNSLVNIVNI